MCTAFLSSISWILIQSIQLIQQHVGNNVDDYRSGSQQVAVHPPPQIFDNAKLESSPSSWKSSEMVLNILQCTEQPSPPPHLPTPNPKEIIQSKLSVARRVRNIVLWGLYLRASLVAQQCGRHGFDPWVGMIPWRRERLPIPVFWPGECHGLYSPWGCRVRHN